MRNALNRRSLLLAACAGAGLLLAGCVTTTAGSVTTITLNVAKVSAYAQAGLNAVATVTDALAMFPTFSAYVAPAKVVEVALQTALANFTAAAGPSVTVSYDDASIKALVDSILADIQSIAGQVATIITKMAEQTTLGISSGTIGIVQTTFDALTTIVSVFRALLVSATAARLVPQHQFAMSESQALRTLATCRVAAA